MEYSILLVVLCITWHTVSSVTPNKSKRGLLDQTHYLTSLRLYPDNAAASTQPQGLSNYYNQKLPVQPPPVKPSYEPEPKVTAQQVLYEYQQTPTNTVSNVHVNQQFQTIPQPQMAGSQPQIAYSQYMAQQQQQQQPHPVANQYQQPNEQYLHNNQYQQPIQYQQPQLNHFTPTESVVNPVQHSAIIQHAPYIANPQNNPYLYGKYLYANGKVLPNPHQHQQVQQQQYQPLQPLKNSNLQRTSPQRFYQPKSASGVVAPVSYQNYQQYPKTTPKPIAFTKEDVKEEQEEDDDEEKGDVREEEEDDDRAEVQEEDDDDNGRKEDYGRYSFEDDDDEPQRYKDEDEEEDEDSNQRGSNKYYNKKNPKKSYSSSYKFKEGFRTQTKSQKPRSKKGKSKPKSDYKAYRYAKGSNGKPRIETIEGKSSQNIPVTVQKVYREKWYITKNSNPDQQN